MNEETKIDFFGDGMRIFLDYITRQHKKNPEYRPHPIIRAFECAFEGIKKTNVDECVIGVSQEGTEKSVYEPYVVVLQKRVDGIEVKEIRNIQIDKPLPVDMMLLIFRLQIHLDKIDGETVNPEQAVDALNAIILGDRFHALGDRWREARDEFTKLLEEGKIHLPRDPALRNELIKLTYDTPWEDYSNRLRSLIGASIAPSLNKVSGAVIVTSPKNAKIEKYKVFDMATQFMLGKVAEYFNPPKSTKTT